MAVFVYKARDLRQVPSSGTIVAESPRQARDQLRSRRLSVLEIAPATARSASTFVHWLSIWRQRRQRAQVPGFLRELSTLLAVGIPLLEALETISRQHKGGFRITINGLSDRIASGMSLAEAMGEVPGVFDELARSIVEVGQHAGTLDTALLRLAEFKERSMQVKGKLGSALLYPAIVLTTAVGVSLFLMTYVVPQLLSGLLQAGQPIPLPTRIVKSISDLIRDDWWLLVLGALAIVLGAVMAWRQRAIRRKWHALQLKIPLFGRLIRMQAISRISIVMATLLKSGVEFVRAIQIAQDSTSNLFLRQALADCEQAVHAGQDIAGALEKTKAVPPLVIQIFAVGQQSGRLEEMLERLSGDYDLQVANLTQRLITILEPLLVVFMVMVVGLIAFATVLPMLEAGNVL